MVSLIMFWPFDLFSEERPYSRFLLLIYIFQTQIILMLWSMAYFSYQAIRNYKSEEIEKWRLQAAVKDAETISIAQELETVRDYLDLESIHMESRLAYSIDSTPELDDCQIPPMAIQLLAENAIKHSLSKRPQGGSVDIAIYERHGLLHIDVRNPGARAPSDPSSTGVGLKNIRDRLQLLCGPQAELTLEQNKTHVISRIRIPRADRSNGLKSTVNAATPLL
ncbi:hypothetical protein QEH56_01785 [Pelagicoccus enzymogenes]|uniref:sensor histidine kinase n=1 Tax=Pelagicoccus enzymogenes TaxID=2773457 RepID=UPI00280FCDE3|nr:hypothetical protein [Pelagicoccus enzymogenes]MDQ8196855.1 hypothetical protein [Pelagicoccus enzymogenes]